jgi:hypothetical protein
MNKKNGSWPELAIIGERLEEDERKKDGAGKEGIGSFPNGIQWIAGCSTSLFNVIREREGEERREEERKYREDGWDTVCFL